MTDSTLPPLNLYLDTVLSQHQLTLTELSMLRPGSRLPLDSKALDQIQLLLNGHKVGQAKLISTAEGYQLEITSLLPSSDSTLSRANN